MQHVYKNIEMYNPKRKCNVSLVFADMIIDMIRNKKLNPIVNQLIVKLNISTVFITQFYFHVPKDVRPNCA